MGGDHEAHNASGEMWWIEDGYWWHADFLRKQSRPYLRPATEEIVGSGRLKDIYVHEWEEAQLEATA